LWIIIIIMIIIIIIVIHDLGIPLNTSNQPVTVMAFDISGVHFDDFGPEARVWNVSDGQCHVLLKGHSGALHSAVFSAG
jgi:hypothetical protein